MTLGDPIKFIDVEVFERAKIRIAVDLITYRPTSDEYANADETKKTEMIKEIYARFAEAIYVSFHAASTNPKVDPKRHILDFIKRFGLNPKIKDLNIYKHKFAVEPYSVTVINMATGEVITMIQFFNEVLTQEIIDKFMASKAGTHAVIMPSTNEPAASSSQE